ncbi:hypothetical protein C0584_06215 [Candidatus Parcubacteria bacterium]|nr:MAG: hypothetical protein C0584_06215 [Candidatus Parcubacteria bacterium]
MKILKILILLIFTFSFFNVPAVQAQNLQDAFITSGGSIDMETGAAIPSPIYAVGQETGYNTSQTIESILGKVILALLSVLGIIFLILLIYAGFLWMTASGNESKVDKARSIMITSVIGLIIVLSAYSISYFVLSSVQQETLQSTTES